jgi:hypothetical protein
LGGGIQSVTVIVSGKTTETGPKEKEAKKQQHHSLVGIFFVEELFPDKWQRKEERTQSGLEEANRDGMDGDEWN